jgi:starch phosphorylase
MVDDYSRKLYDPSHANWMWMEGGNFEEARSRARWNDRVREVWPLVRFVEMGQAPSGPVMSGKPIPVHAALFLAGLKPEDVRVECLIGAISAGGSLENTQVVPLPGTRTEGETAIFEREIIPEQTGRLGYAIRVSPNHDDNPLTRPVTSLLKWGGK